MKAATIAILILPAAFIILGYTIGALYSSRLFKLQKKIERKAKIKKFHIHHDAVGLSLAILAMLLPFISLKVTLAALGIGLFIHHINTEGLKLLTRD